MEHLRQNLQLSIAVLAMRLLISCFFLYPQFIKQNVDAHKHYKGIQLRFASLAKFNGLKIKLWTRKQCLHHVVSVAAINTNR